MTEKQGIDLTFTRTRYLKRWTLLEVRTYTQYVVYFYDEHPKDGTLKDSRIVLKYDLESNTNLYSSSK
jgi:hypothetical protein